MSIIDERVLCHETMCMYLVDSRYVLQEKSSSLRDSELIDQCICFQGNIVGCSQ